MIKFTTNEEYTEQWKGLMTAFQGYNNNYLRTLTAQHFADKLDKAQADTRKSQIVQDVENKVYYD